MSQNISTDLLVVTINARQITNWGKSDPPFRHQTIDEASNLIRGFGGGAVRFDRTNPGESVMIAVLPGSPDAAYLQGLKNSRANITISVTWIGTLENAIGTEGIFKNSGPTDRAGVNVTDDVFNLEFNGWTEMKGGI